MNSKNIFKKTTNGNNHSKRRRRGAGVMVGGAILAAILFTSVYMYFFVIMEAQTTRGVTDSNIQQLENSKKLENLLVSSFENPTTKTINVKIQNTGTIPAKVSYVAMYDEKAIPVDDMGGKKNIGLNPGNELVLETGVVANENAKYKIDAITERGNVITTVWPPEEGQLTPQEINEITNLFEEAITVNIANGLGSLQLDFKSLGVIFHDRQSLHEPIIRSNVDQRGWDSKFGNTTGYPAFLLPGYQGQLPNKPEAIVLRVRNIDPTGENMTLYANTGLGLTLAGQNPNQSPVVYLCYLGEGKTQLEPYKELPSKKIILPNALSKPLSEDYGWTYLYFCDGAPGTSHDKITRWEAQKFAIDLNPIFMVARGEFNESMLQYGQTIPYQAVTITDDSFAACLKSVPTINLKDACPNTTLDKYKGRVGDTVWAYYTPSSNNNSPTAITALWLTPDGQVQKLTTIAATSNPIAITVPSVMPDGTPIEANTNYIIQVIDNNRNIQSMTFRVVE